MKNCVRLLVAVILPAAIISSCGSFENGYLNDDGEGYEQYEPVNGERYTDYGENQFISASETPVSTFSVDCDGASYSNMRRWLHHGQNPPEASVRIEEYLNYFTFDYPEPTGNHDVSTDTEISSCPWNGDHLLMRIGLKGRTVAEEELPPSNYVFLIDISGSMNSPGKLGLLKSGFSKLVDVLTPKDRVAIVTYASGTQVLLPSTNCDEKETIKNAINQLSAGGSTAGAAGITTAYAIAKEYYIPEGNNRIILGSDGDYNVGISDTDSLIELIESKRDDGIYLTVLGVGSGNLNESMMEQLANKGNGNYEYLDCVEQLEKVFINERSKFHTIAKDCKIQVAFNPEKVDKYRLIGYENRVISERDFEDDTKDAGEIGVGQTVTALYEIIPVKEADTDNIASLDVRYKKRGSETSVAIDKVSIGGDCPEIALASENMRFAASIAAFGMKLKGSEFAGNADKSMIISLAKGAITFNPYRYRAEYITLVNKADIK